ncbi:MAG TPA: helicase-related protein [Myxococcota bacterium]|nr:helicase-related protein [Myxococcota bacterium]HQK50762.1 helicase-related protein [Myxococcota bacterium]
MQIVYAGDPVAATRLMREHGLAKAIGFCNSRRRVEDLARGLAAMPAWPPERVMVHHASLSRREREDAERAFRRFEAGLLVCTTALEQGVDIGDVDAVVLVGASDSVASFQQCVGRSCRRASGLLAICVPDL